MNEKKTSVFSNGLIWFGAGVSIAEILTGTYFAPLGFGKAMAAILLGHLIGGLMMCSRDDWCKRTKKCHGNRKNELWREGKPSFCSVECIAAGRMDSHNDL